MQDIPAVPRAAAADAPLNEDVLERGARPAYAIHGTSAAALARLPNRRSLKSFGPSVALAAWLAGVVWLVGSHFVGSPPAVVQQESLQAAGTVETAQKMAEAPAQKVDLEPTGALPSPAAKDVGVASAKP